MFADHELKLKPKLSVIICCYNSSGRIKPTLEHLACQQCENIDWEVVLVDNASTDNTSALAKEVWEELNGPAPLIIVKEDRPGLSHARLRGAETANFELLGFVDDDNWIESNWIEVAATAMNLNPQIGLLGTGNIEPVFETPPPPWLNHFLGELACGYTPGRELITQPAGSTIAGSGMITRKVVVRAMLEQYGEFETTDRQGTKTSSGGDIEFAYVTSMLGWGIAKHGALRMKHFIPSARTAPEYLSKLLRSIGEASNVLDPLRRAATSNVKNRGLRSRRLAYLRRFIQSAIFGTQDGFRLLMPSILGNREYARIVAYARFWQIIHLLRTHRSYVQAAGRAVNLELQIAELASSKCINVS